jgi:hypothetical protein
MVKAGIQEAIRTLFYARAPILGQSDDFDYINRENKSIKYTFRNFNLNLAVFWRVFGTDK